MGILWLKLQQLSYIEKETGRRPILLLDIFCELDDDHSQEVLALLDKQQSFVTTTDASVFEDGGCCLS